MQKTLATPWHKQHSKTWWIPIGLSRRLSDRVGKWIMAALTLLAGLLVPVIALALYWRAQPILVAKPLTELLFSTTWHPLRGVFGFYPFIVGTLWVTGLAMLIAVPPSLLVAIYLAEYASERVRGITKPLIDLLAGIPSVIFGIWGVLTVVPFVERVVMPVLGQWLGFISFFRSDNPTGYGVLAGSLVLAVMVFPIIIAVAEEVVQAVPQGLREASLALGATRWHTIKHVVLKHSRTGVIAAVVLGFSRAFGETMAVLMVVGNIPKVPHSIFDATYPLTALIANNYGEMMSVPLYDAALLGAALILLIVVLGFNLVSRLAILRLVQHE
jgi:phosphate transport system permease protein